MIEVFFSKISEVNDLQFIDKSYSMVSENCKYKAKCFRFEADRLRTIIGELLARYGICHCFGIDASKLRFNVSEFGKPYIVGIPYYFNISHSGDYIICGVSDINIGVDIEKMQDIDFGFACDVFSDEEIRRISLESAEKKKELFFSIWTLKESYVKWLGTGFHRKLSSYTVSPKGMHAEILDPHSLYDIAPKLWTYTIGDYKISICSCDIDFPVEFKYICPGQLIEKNN